MRDIGATELGWWQFWQLRSRIGAMSFEKVTSPAIVVVSAALAAEEPATEITAGTRKASPTLSRQQKIPAFIAYTPWPHQPHIVEAVAST
jgi:hypothetical protein